MKSKRHTPRAYTMKLTCQMHETSPTVSNSSGDNRGAQLVENNISIVHAAKKDYNKLV